jgi:hypothetical protein
LIGLIAAVALTVPGNQEELEEFRMHKTSEIFKSFIKLGWLPYVIFLELLFSVSFGAVAGFKGPFQESIGFSVSMIALLWASSRIGISMLLWVSGWLKERLSLMQLIYLQSLGYAIIFIGIGISSNKWVIALFFILQTIIRWGFVSVKKHYYLEFVKHSSYKVSLISLTAFIEKIFTGLYALLMGFMVIKLGFSISYLYTGIIIAVIFIASLIVLGNISKKLRLYER